MISYSIDKVFDYFNEVFQGNMFKKERNIDFIR